MISDEYNFEKFLDAIKDKDLPEILILASTEAGDAEILSSSSTRGIEKATKMRIGYYKKQVGEFTFFIGHGIKPGGVDEEDFKLYQPICEILICRVPRSIQPSRNRYQPLELRKGSFFNGYPLASIDFKLPE